MNRKEVNNFDTVFSKKNGKLLRCEYFLWFLIFYDRKLNIFGFCGVCGRHFMTSLVLGTTDGHFIGLHQIIY